MKPYIPCRLPLDSIDWSAHVPLIGQANAALARYDGMLQGIVNPAVLLSPLTIQEAVLSSRIEGTQASMEDVLHYEASPKVKIEPEKYADIQEIINYRRAMRTAVDKLKKRPLCLNIIKELHRILLQSVRGRNKSPGEFRRTQNYIGPPGCSIEDATFIPPEPETLSTALGNWEKYLHFDEKDKLVQLAVVKAQFEIIHPFLDGNGRIGRMLIPVFLFTKNVLSSPMFYMSAYLEEHRDTYYQRLQAVSQEGDWNGWISFFLSALAEQAKRNTRTVKAIIDLYEELKIRVVEITHSQFAIQALDALFSKPIFRSSQFQRAARIPTRPTSAAILRKLQAADILTTLSEGRGRRAALLAFPRLINLVEGKSVL